MNVGGRISKRADGRYEARYERGRNPDGTIKYGYCYGRTLEDAEWKRQDAILLIANKDSSDISFSETVKKYKAAAVEHEANSNLLEKYVLSALEAQKIKDIKSLEVRDLLNKHRKANRTDGMLALYNAFSDLFTYSVSQGDIAVSPVQSEMLDKFVKKVKLKASGSMAATEEDYLSHEQYEAFVAVLNDRRSERKLGLLLALTMGIKFSEIMALKISDIDVERMQLTVNKRTAVRGEVVSIPERILPMPNVAVRYFKNIADLYVDGDDYLVKQGKRHFSLNILRSEFVRINTQVDLGMNVELETLRTTFAVNKLRSGVNLVDLAEYMDEPIADLVMRYGSFLRPNVLSVINYTKENEMSNNGKMNLLILGAGAYGHTVKELAEKIGIFEDISFLDDDREKEEAIDVCESFANYRYKYNVAFPAFGENELRHKFMTKLLDAGYIIPKLIHPTAMVSPSCKIENGVIVEANATINANAVVKTGSLICTSALVDRGAVICEYCHIDSNATIVKDCLVDAHTHVRSGEIYDSSLVG